MIRLLAVRAVSAFASALARAVAMLSVMATVAAHLGAVRRAPAIVLIASAGFGHTLIAPDWLRRIHPGKGNLTFFAAIRNQQRYNGLIAELWGQDRFVWVRGGIILPFLGVFYDANWVGMLFRRLKDFLRWYAPNTPCYCSLEDLRAVTPRPDWLAIDHPFNSRYESQYYPLVLTRRAAPLRVSERLSLNVSQALKERFGSKFPRRCAFYLRYLAEANDVDRSSVNRLCAPLADYLPAIRTLIRNGYQVLLTGDALAAPNLIAEMAGGLVDWRAAGVDPAVFQLFAGTEVDIHIGSLSGGSAYVFVTDIPALMLNAFPPGDALPRTTVSYKWLYAADGKLVQLTDMLGGRFYDHQLHGCLLVDQTPQEMVNVVDDFIEHIGERPYGVAPATLGIDAAWIRAADGRLSPIWLRQYRKRSYDGTTAQQ